MNIRLHAFDPSKAYIGTALFLPRSKIAEAPVRGALTFDIDGEARVLLKDHPGHVEVPRAFLTVAQVRDDMGIEVVDLRPTCWAPLNLRPKPNFTLRPHQEAAWKALENTDNGVLNMGCGLGKTIMGLYKAAHEKKRLLIVAEQEAHLQNWESELHAYFDFDGTTGWVGGGKENYDADITFATISTLVRRVKEGRLPEDFATLHGLVLLDEVHHQSAAHYATALDISMGQRIGLTATVKRIDRSEGIFLAHVGPVFYQDLSTDLVPTLEVVRTGTVVSDEERPHVTDVTGEVHVGKLCKWLGKQEARNDVIRERIDRALLEGRVIYALTKSVDHAHLLAGLYPGSGVMTGKVKEGRNEELNKSPLVFATVQVAKENYNRKDLSTLMVLTPVGAADHADAPVLTQAIGRVLRGCPGKIDAEVIFFLDEHIEMSKALTFKALHYLEKKKGFKVRRGVWKGSTPRP